MNGYSTGLPVDSNRKTIKFQLVEINMQGLSRKGRRKVIMYDYVLALLRKGRAFYVIHWFARFHNENGFLWSLLLIKCYIKLNNITFSITAIPIFTGKACIFMFFSTTDRQGFYVIVNIVITVKIFNYK